jgi:dTDP-4-dehydrorhamnose 3,5-epimerase
METYQHERYEEAGMDPLSAQDNISYSVKNTLRGLHFQLHHPQAKLVQAITGKIFDVAVDIRLGSPHFGKWTGVELSSENHRQLYIPVGFAHGFCVLSDTVHVHYKCSNVYHPEDERGVLWSDPDIGIEWPVMDPILSERDQQYIALKDIAEDHLFNKEFMS